MKLNDLTMVLIVSVAFIGWALWWRKQRALAAAPPPAPVPEPEPEPGYGDRDDVRDEADYPPDPPSGLTIIAAALTVGIILGSISTWLLN